jgi:hypothetical protein
VSNVARVAGAERFRTILDEASDEHQRIVLNILSFIDEDNFMDMQTQ